MSKRIWGRQVINLHTENKDAMGQAWGTDLLLSAFSSLSHALLFWFHGLDTDLLPLRLRILWTCARAAWVGDQPMTKQYKSKIGFEFAIPLYTS